MRITQKRKRSNYNVSVKRRRFSKRRYGGRRKTAGNTSKSGTGSQFNYRSRKISRRRWNNELWKSILQKQHVRSVSGVNVSQLSNPNPNLQTVALNFAVNPLFWTFNGGAIQYDPAIDLPAFNGDLVIRGGVIGIRLTNDPADTSPLTVTVYLVKVGKEFNNSNLPTNVSLGWDPSVVPNFSTDVGRVVMQRTFLIENSNSAEVKWRLPIQKVDSSEFTAGCNQYAWMTVVNSANGIATQVTRQIYHNLSFVGDAF